eukprot:TRINITY_DN40314_c0_g1_i2.p1 TRINITY_DN40314_c0_g1~~TRINITY_DN40314_c0_g1_i2.p1  ORF type:complete len:232 (-),score=31.21 TRINITY_DN40314_c0_g1_i2:105-800(-)
MCIRDRFMMHYGNVSYQDELVWGQVFSLRRDQGAYPFDKVPVLHAGETTVAQSGSIARYAAKLAGCYPEDPVKCAFSDAVFEMGQELCTINPLLNCYVGNQHARIYEWYFGTCLPPAVQNLSTQLSIATEGGGSFFGGDTPTHADFNVFHHFDNAMLVEPDCVNSAQLRVWMGQMEQLPGLKEYLDARPRLDGIGVDPRLTDSEGRSVRQRDREGHAWIVDGKFTNSEPTF